MTISAPSMRRTFSVLAAINGLLLAFALFYQSPGEDPAGAGMRLGFAVFYAIALASVLLVYRFGKWHWLRVSMLALLALPLLVIAYGISLSL